MKVLKIVKQPLFVVFAIILIPLLLIIGIGYLAFKQTFNESLTDGPIERSTNFSIDDALKEKSLGEVNHLVEITGESIVAQITDVEELTKLDAQFSRSFNGDLIVFLSDKTIVYDESTGTIRDIIGKSFLETVKNSQK